MSDQNPYGSDNSQDPYNGGQYQPPQPPPPQTAYGSYDNLGQQPSYQPTPQPAPYQPPMQQPYPPVQTPGYGPQYGQQGAYPGASMAYGVPQQADPRKGFAIAGLVLGIVSLVLFWVFYLGIPVAIVGVIMSVLGRRSTQNRTMATVGLVLSIVAIVLSLCIVGFIVYAFLQARSIPTSN